MSGGLDGVGEHRAGLAEGDDRPAARLRFGQHLVQRQILLAAAQQQHDGLVEGAQGRQRALRRRGDAVVVVGDALNVRNELEAVRRAP